MLNIFNSKWLTLTLFYIRISFPLGANGSNFHSLWHPVQSSYLAQLFSFFFYFILRFNLESESLSLSARLMKILEIFSVYLY